MNHLPPGNQESASPESADYIIRPASSDNDLRGIIALQTANLPTSISPEERRQQGFVTLRHNLDLLREMNHPFPHLIATPTHSNEVVAYALVMRPEFRGRFTDLDPMFEQLDALRQSNNSLANRSYYIMGQLCVARPHRGRGIVNRLYAAHRRQMAPAFDLMITVIDAANTRSIRAHQKAGCHPLHQYTGPDARNWLIVHLPLNPDASAPPTAP